MILVFDLTNSDTAHVPFNSGLLQAISAAYPGQQIRFHAEAGHVGVLRQDPALAACGNLQLATIPLSSLYRWRTHIVSVQRFHQELQTLRQALRDAPKEPHLIVLASTTSTGIAAAVLAAKMSPGRVNIQIGLHGNLNDALRWRSRNPVSRVMDMRAMLEWQSKGMRLLVFENSIRDALAQRLPATTGRTDALPHPSYLPDAAPQFPAVLQPPLRIGLVGMATEAKGITPFLEIAADFKARHGDAVEFHIIGGRPHTVPAERFRDIAHEVEIGHIAREVFVERLNRMHFVLLPLQSGYYDLSPSGGLMDALAWAKPVITTRVPMVEDMFRQAGDIGYLCDGTEGLKQALEQVLREMDGARYERQVEAVRGLRASRTPAALATEYRRIVTQGFPGLLA